MYLPPLQSRCLCFDADRTSCKICGCSDHSVSPILNYYKNRYRISILAELSKACNTVREHPHHKR